MRLRLLYTLHIKCFCFQVFEFPHFSDQKTFQTVHQPNISICMTETVSNNNFAGDCF